MSKTLLSRLQMFETLDAYGPMTITELARQSGLDVTVVSRTVSACEPDGWLVRVDGKVILGPRCALLAHDSPSAVLITTAEPLIHAVAGVTGLFAHVTALVGTRAVLMASATGRVSGAPAGLASPVPIYATAGGRAIAAELEPDELRWLLPQEPFPDAVAIIGALDNMASAALFAQSTNPGHRPPLPRTRAELDKKLDRIRADGYAVDRGALHPALHCTAIPWPHQALPVSISCAGPAQEMHDNDELIRRVLLAASQPGATSQEVIAAAA